MGITDLIASFLQDSLETAEDGVLEVQRSDLAQRFNCVPSQINYVMSTRFSPERGYIVESRRGGNGAGGSPDADDARHQQSGRQRGSGVGQSHPQQSGAVRCAGTQRGADDPHRCRRQGTGSGTARKAGCRQGRYSETGADPAGVEPERAGVPLKITPQCSQFKNLYTVYGRN